MSRASRRTLLSPVNLREVYTEAGDHSIKFVIDPASSLDIDKVNVRMMNADGKPMSFSFKRWGTKLNVAFHIDGSTPDGVSIVEINASGKSITFGERFRVWVIKD